MPHLSVLLSSLAIVSAGLQVTAGSLPAAPADRTPVTVHLMTIVDYPGVLGDSRVEVPVVEVKQVIAPRLVVVGEPRIVGIDRTYQPMFGFDRLLVLLPSDLTLSRGQVINVFGEVHTLGGARAMGLPVDEGAAKARRVNGWLWADRSSVIVADSVESADRVPLVGSNRRRE